MILPRHKTNFDLLLDGKPFSALNFEISVNIKLNEDPTLIGIVEAGYLRSGDRIGSDGDRICIWYQDGTTRKINYSWFGDSIIPEKFESEV